MPSEYKNMTLEQAKQERKIWDSIKIEQDGGITKVTYRFEGDIFFGDSAISGHELVHHMHGPIYGMLNPQIDELSMIIAHKIKEFMNTKE